MTIIYTEERIYKTYRLDKQDNQKLKDRVQKLKQNRDYASDSEQMLLQIACDELLEENEIAPIKIDEDSWGEEITSIDTDWK